MSMQLLLSPECKDSSGCFWRSGIRERRAAGLSLGSQADCPGRILGWDDRRQLCSPCPSSNLQQPQPAPSSHLQPGAEAPNPGSGSPTAPVAKLGPEPRCPECPPRAARGCRVRAQLKAFLHPHFPWHCSSEGNQTPTTDLISRRNCGQAKPRTAEPRVSFPASWIKARILKKHQEPFLNLPQVCSKQETFAVSDFTSKSALRKTATVIEGIKN